MDKRNLAAVSRMHATATHDELVAKLDAMKRDSKVFGRNATYTKISSGKGGKWQSDSDYDYSTWFRISTDEVVNRCGTGVA